MSNNVETMGSDPATQVAEADLLEQVLTEREYEALCLYGAGLTQEEIGQRYDVTQQAVSYWIDGIVQKIRRSDVNFSEAYPLLREEGQSIVLWALNHPEK